MDYANAKITEISALPGVADLPFSVRSNFAMALKKEAAGDHEGAEKYLAKAIENESSAST